VKLTLTIIAALIGSVAAWGHHSFAAEYDGNKPVSLHSWLHIKVMEDGKEVEWLCETAPPNGLYRQGWRKDSLKEGEQVTVEGFRAKDSSNTMTARSVITADGRRMFAGTATDGAPGSKQ